MIGKLTMSRYPDKLHAELFTGTTKIGGTIFTPNFFLMAPFAVAVGSHTFNFKGGAAGSLAKLAFSKDTPVYSVFEQSKVGDIMISKVKEGLFSSLDIIRFAGTMGVYDMYQVGLGQQGVVWVIYSEGRQVAEILLESLGTPDKTVYQVRALESAANAVWLMAMYLVVSHIQFPPMMGEKSNSKLLAKYNPQFMCEA